MLFQKTTATNKILNLTKRLRAVPGGSSASKTISILLYLIAMAQSDKIKTLTSVCSESIPHLKRGAIRDFKSIMQAHSYWKDSLWNQTDSIYTFETGSQIEFFSTDNGDKLRGARRDRLFINEANNVTFEAFEQLEIRTKDFILLDWNPSNEFWYYTEIKGKRDDLEEITLTYLDNEALDQQIVDSLEQRKNRKGWWQVYGLGQLSEVEGKIYRDWQIIDEIPHQARLERYGIDFGYTNDPTAIVAVYFYDGGYILDEIAFMKGLSNKQIADLIKNHSSALSIADSAEPKSIDEIMSYGINITGAVKGADSIRNGIQLVQSQRMSITKRSINIIKEYRNYMWITDKNGKILNQPEGGFDHCFIGSTLITMGDGTQKKLKDIKVGEIVKTLQGYHNVLLSRKTRREKVYEAIFSNGEKLIGTGDHKVYTSKGIKRLDSLGYSDAMIVCENKLLRQSFLINRDIIGMVNTIVQLEESKKVGKDYIKQFGLNLMGQYHLDIISITKTKIEQTIKSLTLNLNQQKNICQNIQKKTGLKKNLNKKEKHILMMLDILPRYGILLKKELSGIENKERGLGKISQDIKKYVKYVDETITLISPLEQDFAIRIVRLKPLEKEQDVYNLTVDIEHNYYANGFLVKNCMDAIRYAMGSIVKTQGLSDVKRMQSDFFERNRSNFIDNSNK